MKEIFKPLKPIAELGKAVLDEKADEFLIAKSTGGREPWKTIARIRKYYKDSKKPA